jgi:putative membrane protein
MAVRKGEICRQGEAQLWEMNKMMGNGSGMGGFWLSWFFGALILLGIVIIGVVVVRGKGGALRGQRSAQADHRTKKNSHARTMLDERYARGELTTEEYLQRLEELQENR